MCPVPVLLVTNQKSKKKKKTPICSANQLGKFPRIERTQGVLGPTGCGHVGVAKFWALFKEICLG